MKLFIVKSFIYLCIIFGIGIALTYTYMKMFPLKLFTNPVENMIFSYQNNLVEKKIHFKKVIIGDSRPFSGFNSRIISSDLINISTLASSPIEGYIMLKKILSKNTIDTLIISYAPNRFTQHGEIIPFIYNNFFSEDDLDNIENLEKKFQININNSDYSVFSGIERKMILHKNLLFIRGVIIDSHRKNQPHKGKNIMNEIKNDLGFSVLFKRDSSNAIAKEDIYNTDKQKCKINPVVLSYMDSIYNTCLNNNIKLVFVEFPVNNATYQKLSKTNFEAFLQSKKQLFSQKYPKMVYYDKYKVLPNIYFGDEYHLNVRGSNFFSTEFRKDYFKN